MKKRNKVRVAAIVPAFNEEKNIAHILGALNEAGCVTETIVVDDGSTDRTAEVARARDARVLSRDHTGKGAAMRAGALATDAEVLLFLDADLVGITPSILDSLVAPLVWNNSDMSIGLRDRGPFWSWMMRHILPLIGGERAMSRRAFLECSSDCTDFGIESTINAYARAKGLRVTLIPMKGVSHVIKERKYGLGRGLFRRLVMISQLVRTELHLINKF